MIRDCGVTSPTSLLRYPDSIRPGRQFPLWKLRMGSGWDGLGPNPCSLADWPQELDGRWGNFCKLKLPGLENGIRIRTYTPGFREEEAG